MSTPEHRQLSIVLCDDDPFALRFMSSLLKACGQEFVRAFEDSSKCMEFLIDHAATVDLIICDLQMPKLDGIELLNGLADMSYKGHIVLVSGEDKRVLKASENLAASRELKVLGVVSKPIQRSVLSDLVAKALENTLRAENNADQTQVGLGALEVNTLRQGLESGAFIPFFQPKVSLLDYSIKGFEALARWKHPTQGLLAPGAFLTLLEAFQLTDRLLWQVLLGKHGVLESMCNWKTVGLDFSIALNLSDQNLLDPSLPKTLLEEVQRFGLEPGSLVLEISEKRSDKNRVDHVANLLRLNLKGFGLSLDDFGTGQSSMLDLKDLPLTEVKFDRSYISGIHQDATKQSLILNCIKMAKSLGLTTVAEGVETKDEWRYLRSIGCDYAQGYLVSKPLEASAVPHWVERWNAKYAARALQAQVA